MSEPVSAPPFDIGGLRGLTHFVFLLIKTIILFREFKSLIKFIFSFPFHSFQRAFLSISISFIENKQNETINLFMCEKTE